MLLAPSISGLFKWRQFEPEVILLAGRLVPALFALLPRGRGVARRAWSVGRPCHRLALGPALRPGNGAALTPAPQAD